MQRNMLRFWCLVLCLFSFTNISLAAVSDDIVTLRQEWAKAKFQTPRSNQINVFENLIRQAEQASGRHPNNPEVMVWHATILSTYASIKGGMGVLKHVKKARDLLERAISMNPRVTNGFAHGVLGALYARVPGWPVAFGDNKKAENHFKTGLQIDPNGADTNFYYGDFLVDRGEKREAMRYLEKARRAPIRRGYEVHDRGRKGEITRSMRKAGRGR